jgi:hypothetical protein
MKVIPTPTGTIQQLSSSELDTSRHACTVRFHVSTFVAERLASEAEETHTVRYFFLLELELFLETAGFKALRLGAFPEFYREPDEQTWNALCVGARHRCQVV